MAGDGFSKVIHDLRAPLTSVRSLSEILRDYSNINGEKRREFLDIILQEADRMTGIIKQAESPVQSMPGTVQINSGIQKKGRA
jgi:signal transduction histidine kinase